MKFSSWSVSRSIMMGEANELLQGIEEDDQISSNASVFTMANFKIMDKTCT